MNLNQNKIKSHIKNHVIKRYNQGYILITGLILLLIITSLALYGSTNSITQEMMSGSVIDKQVALQNAETGLRVAEIYIYNNINNNSAFDSNCANGLCIVNSTTPVWQSITWDTDVNHTINVSGSDLIPNAVKQPKYIIELLDQVPAPPGESAKINSVKSLANAYRVTVVGYGNNVGSRAMLQSIFVKR